MKDINKKQHLLNILFIISVVALQSILSIRGTHLKFYLGLVVTPIVAGIMCYRFKFVELALHNTTKMLNILSGICSLFSLYYLAYYFLTINSWTSNSLKLLVKGSSTAYVMAVAIISGWAIFLLFSYFFSTLKDPVVKFVKSITKYEYFYLIVVVVIFTAVTFVIYSQTSVFYKPIYKNEVLDWDVVYTTDSPYFIATDVYTNVKAYANDIRQPFFAIFALPFTYTAVVLSKLLFFIPNSYVIALIAVQAFVLALTVLMLTRLMKLNKITKRFFMAMIFICYPFMLFSILLEQYVYSLFYLILFIYVCLNYQNQRLKDLVYLGATGSLLTTGILFPLLASSKAPKKSIKEIAFTACKFFSLIFIFALIPIYPEAPSVVNAYKKFTGYGLTFINKLLQYINFVAISFLRPEAGVNNTTFEFVSYQQTAVKSLNTVGVIIIALTIVSFIVNRRRMFAKISFFWAIFSFIVLCAFGWGTGENGLLLYSLYFAWAFICIIFMLVDKFFSNKSVSKIAILSTVMIVLLYFNVKEVMQLVRFGIKYYPR